MVCISVDKTSIEAHYGWFQLNPALSMVLGSLLCLQSCHTKFGPPSFAHQGGKEEGGREEEGGRKKGGREEGGEDEGERGKEGGKRGREEGERRRGKEGEGGVKRGMEEEREIQ